MEIRLEDYSESVTKKPEKALFIRGLKLVLNALIDLKDRI